MDILFFFLPFYGDGWEKKGKNKTHMPDTSPIFQPISPNSISKYLSGIFCSKDNKQNSPGASETTKNQCSFQKCTI